MGADTNIEWTDATWNPVRGCSRVSEGCRHCYAEGVAARFSGPGLPYEGLARRAPNGDPRWTGVVRLVPEHLGDPLRWTRPRRVFVNSMSDLFHEGLTFEDIAVISAVMGAASRHTFQILTKRAERMAEFFRWSKRPHPETIPGWVPEDVMDALADLAPGHWPVPNVWLGVSVEDQAALEDRLPHLQATPAAVRFLSVEPQLGPVDLRGRLAGIHWVIVGGESGPRARPFQLDWARDIVATCRAAGVAVFVKQLGAAPMDRSLVEGHDELVRLRLGSKKGGKMDEWPARLQVREWPAEQPVLHVEQHFAHSGSPPDSGGVVPR